MPRQILTLLDIIRRSNWRQREFVQARYHDVARNFDRTLAFLEQLGWLKINASRIEPTQAWLERIFQPEADSPEVQLLDALLECSGPHRSELVQFLDRFEVRDNALVCSLAGEASLASAAARDFLMDLGAVIKETGSTTFALNDAFAGAAFACRTLRTPRSKASAQLIQESRDELGLAAELAASEFERSRVGPHWASRVRHVSRERPFACYDIQSVTVCGAGVVTRYIEVKAVSPGTYEFHWSASEIEAAQVLRDRYFLYLIPVLGVAEFDLAHLKMISDPFVLVYQNGDHWIKQPTHFICRPTRPTTS